MGEYWDNAICAQSPGQMACQNRKVLLFLDNAPCHPEMLQQNLTNIELKFLPKNTTSRLQPCDAGIIRSFKLKYRKLLVRYIVSRIDSGSLAADIVKDVNILRSISWIQRAWSEVTCNTIKHCFEKCGFMEPDTQPEEDDIEFEELLKELSSDTSTDEFISFDDDVDTCEPAVDTSAVDWRQTLRSECISIVQSESEAPQETIEDDSDIEEEPVDTQARVAVTFSSALEMLDEIQYVLVEQGESDLVSNSLANITQRIEQLRIAQKKSQKKDNGLLY